MPDPRAHTSTPPVRYRLYIDEVGNGDLSPKADDPNGRYLSLTGVIARVKDYSTRFSPAVNGLKTSAFGPDGANIILHRRELVRREGEFKSLVDPVKASSFDAHLLRIVKELPYIATTVTIDKVAHLDIYGEWIRDPYDYCLQALVERYVLWMHRNRFVGDVAIEGRGKKPDRLVKQSFQAAYASGTEHISSSIIQRRLTSNEIKFMRKSDNCPIMQLVDVIAHPSFRAMKMARLNLPTPDDFGARLVSILDEWKYARHPKTRIIEGWGKKWLPK